LPDRAGQRQGGLEGRMPHPQKSAGPDDGMD
jgi:hypothetical protein